LVNPTFQTFIPLTSLWDYPFFLISTILRNQPTRKCLEIPWNLSSELIVTNDIIQWEAKVGRIIRVSKWIICIFNQNPFMSSARSEMLEGLSDAGVSSQKGKPTLLGIFKDGWHIRVRVRIFLRSRLTSEIDCLKQTLHEISFRGEVQTNDSQKFEMRCGDEVLSRRNRFPWSSSSSSSSLPRILPPWLLWMRCKNGSYGLGLRRLDSWGNKNRALLIHCCNNGNERFSPAFISITQHSDPEATPPTTTPLPLARLWHLLVSSKR